MPQARGQVLLGNDVLAQKNFTFWLMATTHEYVHLVTRSHFRSRDKDGDHTIQSAISENPLLHANFMALCFIEPDVWTMEVLRWHFRPFLLLWPWPWPDDLQMRTWSVFPCDTGCTKINFVRQGFRKLYYILRMWALSRPMRRPWSLPVTW